MTRRILKLRFVTLLSFALAFLLIACEAPSQDRPLKFSSSYWVGYEPFFVAEIMGFYEPGSVHLIETPESITLQQALWAGSIDAAAVSSTRALSLVEQGHDITIVAVIDWSNGADSIYATPSIKAVSDLKGKSVAAEAQTVNAFLLSRALELHEVGPEEVSVIPILNKEAAEAYRDGKIQAASVFGYAVDHLASMGAHSIFDSADIPGEVIDVLVVRTAYLQRYPHQVAKLIRGWQAAVTYLEHLPDGQSHPEGLMKSEDYRKARKGVKFASLDDNISFLENGGERLESVLNVQKGFFEKTGGKKLVLPAINSGPILDVVMEKRE
jgi:NitT/TauT family transport system substrate-binding protein